MQSILYIITKTFSNVFIKLEEWELFPGISFLAIVIVGFLLSFIVSHLTDK